MIRGYRLASGSCGAENTLSGHSDTPGLGRPRRSLSDFAFSSFVSLAPGNRRPAADEGIDDGALPSYPISPTIVHHGGRDTDRNRSVRRRGGRESEDGTGHKSADRANGEDGRCENVSPNAHSLPPCVYRGHCPDPGSAARNGQLCPFPSLLLLT
jgi:hypothetical protein